MSERGDLRSPGDKLAVSVTEIPGPPKVANGGDDVLIAQLRRTRAGEDRGGRKHPFGVL